LAPRSTAERPADLLRAAVDEASLEAAELAPAASDARRGDLMGGNFIGLSQLMGGT